MKEWVDLLSKFLPHRPDAGQWLLGELGRSPTILRELLLSPVEVVRDATGRVIVAALKQVMMVARGRGGDREDGVDDPYLAVYTIMMEEEEQDDEGAKGFVAVGREAAAVEREDDGRLARKMVRGCGAGVEVEAFVGSGCRARRLDCVSDGLLGFERLFLFAR